MLSLCRYAEAREYLTEFQVAMEKKNKPLMKDIAEISYNYLIEHSNKYVVFRSYFLFSNLNLLKAIWFQRNDFRPNIYTQKSFAWGLNI